jgi:hypothetical protein
MTLHQALSFPKSTPRLQQIRKQLEKPAKPDVPMLKKVRKVLTKSAPSLDKSNKSAAKEKFVEEIALGWKDKLTFGKYNGKTLKFIFNQDPMYLAYIQTINKNIVYSADVMKKLAPFLVEEEFEISDEENDLEDQLAGIDLYNG